MPLAATFESSLSKRGIFFKLLSELNPSNGKKIVSNSILNSVRVLVYLSQLFFNFFIKLFACTGIFVSSN